MQEAIPYPLDFDALSKGDYVPPEQIEQITQESRHSAAYAWGILRLAQMIVDQLAERNPPLYVVVKQEKNGLRIQDDESASSYTFSESERAMRMLKRNYARMVRCVDTSEFGDATMRLHENRIAITSAMLRGAMDGRKSAFSAMRKRPALPQLNVNDDISPVNEDLHE